MKKCLLQIEVIIIIFFSAVCDLSSQVFTEQTSVSLSGVSNGAVAWGDYDNDGDLDILVSGIGPDNYIVIKVFHNDGDNSFTDLGNVFSPAISNGHSYTRCNALWDDFDNDGNIDLLIRGQTSTSGNFITIYKNDANNSFTHKTTISYLTMWGSAVDCGDYDNDGDKDILLTYNNSSVIYQNQGEFAFIEQYSILSEGIAPSSCKWGDYDNDGDLDVFTASSLFQNEGNNVFMRQDGISLHSDGESFDWGDYNNDGFLDILQTGNGFSGIYKNNSNNTFTEQTGVVLKGVQTGIGKWGDLDNDGDLDIIIPGDNGGNNITAIYFNNGDNSFTEVSSIVLDAVKESSVDLGDYDNDGDLDILLSGNKGILKITKLYKNESSVANPAPAEPTGLSSEIIGSDIILKWKAVSTDNTTTKAISYNILVGTTSGDIDVVCPNSSSTGHRRISAMGNGQLDSTFILRNLKKGTYYWKVQAVDNSFKGSDFSNQAIFTYSVSYQAFGLNVPVIGGKEATLTWSRGNGANCIVFMKEGKTGNALPANTTSYTASGIYKTGSQIDNTGWYCVYTGTQSEINVTGLDPDTDYIYQVFEFDGIPGSEDYNIQTLASNPLTFKTGHFTELRNVTLQSVNTSNYNEQTPTTCWFDFDNDDDLDLLLVGMNASVLYRNDGNDLFTLMPVVLSKGYSAACGDYNNDGFIDIIIGYNPSRLYRNNGDGTFSEETGISLPDITLGSINWGDYNNDGYSDIIMTGNSSGTKISKIFKNNGDNTFSEQNLITLIGVAVSSSNWGDYNNDGFHDLLISGFTNSGSFITKVYQNTGNNNFMERKEIVLPIAYGLAEWGDFDNDGDLDIFLSDIKSSLSKIYRNDGNSTFSEQAGISLNHIRYGSAEWGDYDNDGDKDLLITGSSGSSQFTILFNNNGSNTFTEDNASSVTDVGYSSASWGDYDNDGDLDIALTGISDAGPVSRIYRNDINTANIKPAAPEGLISNVNKSDVTLRWTRVGSDNTPCKAISYNIKVGTTSGGINVVCPNSSAAGFRKVVSMGNCNLDSAYILKKLPFGTYYWSVQSIDNSLAGGPFSAEGTFDVVPVQAKSLSAKILNNNSLLLKWERGNGDRCIVFCKQTSSGMSTPVDNTGYIADNEFGYGAQIGSTGWYCIYNGRADSVNVSGLIYQKEYSFHVIEYMGTFGSEQYFTQVEDGNPGVFSTSLFAEQTGITFGTEWSNPVAWGDYDKDGFLDLLLPGSPCRIYHNNGDNTFSELTGLPLFYSRNGSAQWGDYDNDGDLDFIISGAASGDFLNPVTKIFRNEGSNTFTDQAQISLIGVYYSSVVWGDYDNDGDLDILLTGATGADPDFKPVSRIYRNNGNNTFTEQSQISLQGVFKGSGIWADYDNDGDLDILINGPVDFRYQNYIGIAKIYKNNRNNTFIEQTQIQLPGYSWSSSAWGDYDNDGDLDFLLTSFGSISIYENLGNNIFTEHDNIYLDAYSGSCSAAWGDYNNDGYLDILVTNPNLDSRIFKNIYGKRFNQQDDESLKSAGFGFVSWADYDNDGDLDFVFAKGNNSPVVFKNNLIMKSGLFKSNMPPSAPTGILSAKSPNGVTLKWNPVKTDETSYEAMTYNIRLGTPNDSSGICSAQSDLANGYRRIPAMGNFQADTTFLIKNLPSGKYFWQVQAVDQGLMGGAWSSVDSFEVRNVQTFFSADTVCLGFSTHFTDQSVAADGVASWKWDFKDGTKSTSQNPVHTFSVGGAYNVKLVIISTGGVKDSLEQNVIIKPRATTGFSAIPTCQGLPLSITNTTDNNGLSIISWHWEFGDGQTSAIQQPAPHGYLIAGDYQVKLKAVADNGCADSITKTVTLANYPAAVITASTPLTFCSGDSVILLSRYFNNYSYQWLLNGIPVTDADSSRFVTRITGNYSVDIINTIGNCKTTSDPVYVTVKSNPSIPKIVADNYVPGRCNQESTITLRVDQPLSSYVYRWKRNGTPVNQSGLSYLQGYLAEGDYTVEVDNDGCKKESMVQNISYENAPKKPDIYVRGPVVWYMAASNDSASGYIWYFNNEVIPGATRFIYVANQTLGTYKVAIRNEYGCVTMSDEITIPVSKSAMTDFVVPEEFLIKDANPFARLKIYPNPTPGLFTIRMENNILGDLDISILTPVGKEIFKIRIEKTTEHFLTEVDLSGQPDGLYIINLMVEKYSVSRKLIVE